MDTIHVLSYGGGVNSSALYFYLREHNRPLDVVIFADTGCEHPSTYRTVEVMRATCKKDNIPFIVVQSKYGNLYEYYQAKQAVMSIKWRDCTSKFKIRPIRAWLRQHYGKHCHFNQYIGIGVDEMQRMTQSDVQYSTLLYPFCEARLTRLDQERILRRYGFHAQKSGCVGCPFQSQVSWKRLRRTNPAEFNRWLELERRNRGYPRITISGKWRLEDLRNDQGLATDTEDCNEAACPQVRGGCFQ